MRRAWDDPMPAHEAIEGITDTVADGSRLAALADRLVDLAGGIGGGPPWPPTNYGAVLKLLEAAKWLDGARANLAEVRRMVQTGRCRVEFAGEAERRGRPISPAEWRHRLLQAGYSSTEIDAMEAGAITSESAS